MDASDVSDPAPTPGRRAAILWFAAAVILLAPGVFWGLPEATDPGRTRPWGSDELAPVGPAAELYSVFVRRGDGPYNPQYPLLQYVMQGITSGPYYLWLMLTGGMKAPAPEFPYGLGDPIPSLKVLTVLCRIPSLLMAAGTVVLARATAGRLWDARAGALAAASTALAYHTLYFGRVSNPDMGALFWSAAGLYVLVRCIQDGLDRRAAIWLAITAAAAVGSKDAAYAKFVVIGLVVLWRHVAASASASASAPASQRTEPWGRRLALPGLAFGVAAVLYPLTSGLAFSWPRFVAHVQFITQGSELESGILGRSLLEHPATLAGYAALAGDVVGHMRGSLGTPLFAMSLVGLAVCVRRHRSAALVALPALGLLLGVIAPVRFVLFRYVIFVAYTLCLFGGYGLSLAIASAHGRVRTLAWAGVLGCFAWMGVRGVDLTTQMLGDARYEMGEWIARNARDGDRIGFFGGRQKLPPLAAGIEHVHIPSRILDETWGGGDAPDDPEFLVVIPQQMWEIDHEFDVPADLWTELLAGTGRYVPYLSLRAPALFEHRTVPYVNPPIRLFVRTDVVPRLADPEPRLELAK